MMPKPMKAIFVMLNSVREVLGWMVSQPVYRSDRCAAAFARQPGEARYGVGVPRGRSPWFVPGQGYRGFIGPNTTARADDGVTHEITPGAEILPPPRISNCARHRYGVVNTRQPGSPVPCGALIRWCHADTDRCQLFGDRCCDGSFGSRLLLTWPRACLPALPG